MPASSAIKIRKFGSDLDLFSISAEQNKIERVKKQIVSKNFRTMLQYISVLVKFTRSEFDVKIYFLNENRILSSRFIVYSFYHGDISKMKVISNFYFL